MDKINIVLTIEGRNKLNIRLRRGDKVIARRVLTIDQNLDTLLIVSIDNILRSNSIDRLSLKSLEIQGKIGFETASGMILSTVKTAFRI